jgi:hypothetical protein
VVTSFEHTRSKGRGKPRTLRPSAPACASTGSHSEDSARGGRARNVAAAALPTAHMQDITRDRVRLASGSSRGCRHGHSTPSWTVVTAGGGLRGAGGVHVQQCQLSAS